VNRIANRLSVMLMTTALYALSSQAAEPATSEVPVAKDLTAVIALQGLPCGQVVDVRQKGDNDYVASCEDGHQYRVFVNAEGRVVVEKK
jgi:hypothetical protein